MKTRSNDFAYPHNDGEYDVEYGLTKREYFAVCALQGLLANPDRDLIDYGCYERQAIDHADSLIDVLNTENK